MDVLDEHTLMTEGSKNRLNYAGAMVTSKSESSDIPEDKVLPSDTWYIATINAMAKEKENYPTQKPEALLSYLIRTYTREGEVVLDNCMGSGSTGVACIQTGRMFIGMEKEEKYFQIAKMRLEREESLPKQGVLL